MKASFRRADFAIESSLLYANSLRLDGRTSEAKRLRKLAAMLAWADANLPAGIPDSSNRKRRATR